MFNEVLDSDFYLTWIFLYPHITFTSNKPEQMFEDIITSIQNTNIEAERQRILQSLINQKEEFIATLKERDINALI